MEKTNLLTLVVTLTVGIILAGSLLMPVINDAQITERTYINEGVFNYGIFSPTDEYSLTFDKSTGAITVNNEEVTPITGVSPTDYGSYSVLATDNVLLRYGANSGGYYMNVIGKDSNGDAISGGGNSVTATITDGKLSATFSLEGATVTKTFDFTEIYGIVKDASDAVLKVSNSDVYVLGDSELYASGITNVAAWNNMFHFEGTINDGITITSPNLPDATYENITWNTQEIAGFNNVYKLTSVEFDIVNNGVTTHATYSYFAVPSEVTAERTNHLDDASIAIISALPILIIVALVVMAAGALYFKRDD